MSKVKWLYNRGYAAANFRLRSFAGGKLAAHCRPVTIVFLLTERCNARCLHCDIWKNSGIEDIPSLQQRKTCLRELRKWLGPVHVTFTGGEALLQSDTIELVQYASSLGLLGEFLTNGYCSDQSKLEKLALARPWRVTISLDGLERSHNKIRGHDDFFGRTSASIQTLCRTRRENGLKFSLLLKTVIMEHNLDEVASVAHFAAENALEVLYQPIEQNYNNGEDPEWYRHSENWPRDPARVKAVLSELEELKRSGLPIANTCDHIQTMATYFENPAQLRLAVQSHVAPSRASTCSATTSFQVQANGDVRTCARRNPVGNIRTSGIREIWEKRPRFWETGCCRQ